MNSRVFVASALCTLLAGCGAPRGGGCACIPPPPAYMAVAQRGANEVSIYALTGGLANPPDSVKSVAPVFTISAPGAESLMRGAALYVGEYPNTIAVFNAGYGAAGLAITPAGSITTGVNDPAGFALSAFDGTESLFVANRGANDIAVYTGFDNVAIGNTVPALTISGLNAPSGIAFDSKGDLWVCQSTSVAEFVPPFTTASTPTTTITSGLQSPSAVAFDWTGTMYVADKAQNAIVVYPAGSTRPSVAFTTGMSEPASLFINGSYLHVANAAGGDVVEYRLPLNSSSQPIGRNAVNMNQPAAITVIQ
jgi:hypothetical protein